MLSNRAVIAAAGSGKTEAIIEEALSLDSGRVLILTFTNENQRQILARLKTKSGIVPRFVSVMGWFSFLINEGARPYQSAMTGEVGRLGGLNFVGRRSRFTRRDSLKYFMDRNSDLYRDGVSDFVCRVNKNSEGRVIRRIESAYSAIFVDEFQDLVGYDLEFIDLLLQSSVPILLVGDPRQHTYSTNLGQKNKKYQGEGILDWLKERNAYCDVSVLCESHRCNQELCDFADDLFPSLPRTTSLNHDDEEHRGVFVVDRSEVEEYVKKWNPVILRRSRSNDTGGLPAINIGVAKGSTFERVLVFPSKTMLKYVRERDLSSFKDKARLYVAVTRARHSVAFVAD